MVRHPRCVALTKIITRSRPTDAYCRAVKKVREKVIDGQQKKNAA
jgi:hypothetical protein